MRRVTVGIIMGALILTSLAWAGGGKNRHGQDGTQPRAGQSSTGATVTGSQCPGLQQGTRQLRLRQGQLEGPTVDAQERGIKQKIRDRKRDGSCQTSAKPIRDRKRDGSCRTAGTQTRTRTRARTGTA